MKTKICLGAVLVLFASDALAQRNNLTYRDSDPFLFCKTGQNPKLNPLPCWKPMPPYTGAWMPMWYCRPYNKYGKRWSNDDRKSLGQYQYVCPIGEQPGDWKGKGRPEIVPHDH